MKIKGTFTAMLLVVLGNIVMVTVFVYGVYKIFELFVK